MINLKINDIPVSVPEGSTLLEAARSIGIKIPTLCHMKDISELGACRVCVVEVNGMRSLVAACEYPAMEGMEVYTSTKRVFSARKTTLELILSDHRKDCLSCERNTNCELQRLAYKYDCDSSRFAGQTRNFVYDDSTDYLIRDNSKCILCRRCIAMCKKVQGIGAIGTNDRGFDTHVACAFDMKLNNTVCIGCGQCVNVCPTGALKEKSEVDRMWEAMNNPRKYVVAGTAPAVRAALAEEFDMSIGTNCQGKINTALRYLGFKQVFDINCSADFTIMEEAHELVNRIVNGGKLPMFTSCCPGWITYCEKHHPELLENLSTCKSPQQMFGALVKQTYAKRNNLDPKDVFVVTIMPCTAKKGEKTRTFINGIPDIDAVLTTRELAHVLKGNGILLNDVPDGEADNPFSEYSGAGIIFGATGGVMEAALRTAVSIMEPDSKFTKLEFAEVRGLDGVKEATYTVAGKTLKIAVANGIKNAQTLCEKIKNGEADYHFVEVMTCPGGCVMGGGQPIKATYAKHRDDVAKGRASVLYNADKAMSSRRSHKNGSVNALYAEVLGEPNGPVAHELLHTTYKPLAAYIKEE